MLLVFQFVFIFLLLFLGITKKFSWNKFIFLNFIFFILALFFPKLLMGMDTEPVESRLRIAPWIAYGFAIIYLLPGFCVVKIRQIQMLKIKSNVLLDYIIGCILFFVLSFVFYILLMFLPLSYYSIKTSGVGP
jgi:hypothetical protein